MNTTSTRTPAIFDTFAQRDEFLGFGYIGERARHIESGMDTTAADALALEMAATLTDEALFTWGNSKDGRWFADCALGCNDLAMARRYGPKA